MSLFGKIKNILFDEDIIEVPVGSDELPDRVSKKVQNNNTGFIDHGVEEEIDDSPIKEIKIPKEEEIIPEEPKRFNLQDDFKDDLDDDFLNTIELSRKEINRELEEEEEEDIIPSRSRSYDDLELSFMDDKEEVKTEKVVSGYRVNEPTEVRKELKDYRKMLSAEPEENTEKKPFKNTPVISPVWGILEKNYTPDEIVDKTDSLNKINCGLGERNYGPVSYNDQPLPHANYKKPEKKEMKEELVELNNTISEMVEEEIEVPETKVKIVETTVEIETPKLVKEEVVENVIDNVIEDNDDDMVIQTDDYDNYDDVSEVEMPKHSLEDVQESIEEEISTDIEDAFESTSEFNTITENDKEEDIPEVDFETIVPKKIDLDDDEGLDNTIETDLFNLIDSMYRDEEEDE